METYRTLFLKQMQHEIDKKIYCNYTEYPFYENMEYEDCFRYPHCTNCSEPIVKNRSKKNYPIDDLCMSCQDELFI